MNWHDRPSRDIASAYRRPLSKPESAGWRQTWDGWATCPACVTSILADPTHAHRKGEWPVPADYSTPIEITARCHRCSFASGRDPGKQLPPIDPAPIDRPINPFPIMREAVSERGALVAVGLLLALAILA